MAKSKTTDTVTEETPQVEETTPVVDVVPETVEQPVVEELTPELPQETAPIYIPEIPAQVEEIAPVFAEGFVPLHKRNKCRS